MAIDYLTHVDLHGNEIRRSNAENLVNAPSTPNSGRFYFNSSDGFWYYYNGSSWIAPAKIIFDTSPQLGGNLDFNGHNVGGRNLTQYQYAIDNAHEHDNKATLDLTTAVYTTSKDAKVGYITITQSVDLDTLESDTGLNNIHRSSDGTSHSHVVLNDTHRTGDGSDHADVATNTSNIATLNSNVSTTGSVLKLIKDNAESAIYDNVNVWLTSERIDNALDELATRTHNSTTSIQGGTSGEFYHLSSSQHNALNDANAQLSNLQTDGTPTFSTVNATTFTGALTGNATTATTLQTARTISLSGDVSGSVSFNGSQNVNIVSTVANNSHTHVSTNISDATSASTGLSKVIIRDASGRAQVVDPTALQDIATKNYVDTTISTSTSATADKLTTARNIELTGDVTGNIDFDGSQNVDIVTTVGDDSHYHTAAYVTDFDVEVANNSAVTANTAKRTYPIGDETKVGYISVTGAVNLDNMQSTTEKGQANGYAGLDSTGVVPISQLPDTILGGLQYINTYDASSGSYPTAGSGPSGEVEKGDYFVVNTPGIINTVDYENGDWMVYNGVTWDKIDNSDKVSSVAGKTGTITLNHGDITNFQSGVSLNTDLIAKTDKESFNIGNNSNTDFTLVHSLNTQNVTITIRESTAPYAVIYTDVEITDNSTVTVKFVSAPTTNQYIATLVG